MREDPAEAQIVSHRFMLRAGMIRQSASGIYTWLPLGLRVLRKIESIVRAEQNRIGAQEVLMPTIQPADLWKKSGRYEDYGREMLRITDRNDRELLYGPTNEEIITEAFSAYCRSHKDVPKLLYHIQWKFRDEIRPRFGVMRGREFLMKDAYSFDLDREAALRAYRRMFICYLKTFERLGLRAIPMRAETGPIGGDNSHEFIVLAETGESEVFCDRALLDFETKALDSAAPDDTQIEQWVRAWLTPYAATEDMHDVERFAALPSARRVRLRGIEAGHIFYFGTKYSRPLGALLSHEDGRTQAVHMGSYGIGISRLVGTLIEAYHDERGIRWPLVVAPFHAVVLNLAAGEARADERCHELCHQLEKRGIETLYDDRDARAGSKLADAERMGIPFRLVIGSKTPEGQVEFTTRHDNKTTESSLEKALDSMVAALRVADITPLPS